MTRAEALKLSDKELNARIDELSYLLDRSIDWDDNYAEYCMINNILENRYREENMEAFEKFFFEHIYGKEWNQIDGETLDWYSDWHKDMFGYRPRSTDKDW